jgi:transposase-like protein
MSIEMEEEIKRWTARRKSALVLDIIQGKTTVSESSRQFDLPPSEIESWIDQAKSGMENALKARRLNRKISANSASRSSKRCRKRTVFWGPVTAALKENEIFA